MLDSTHVGARSYHVAADKALIQRNGGEVCPPFSQSPRKLGLGITHWTICSTRIQMSFELKTMLINDIRSHSMAGLAASFEGTVSAIERKMANGEAATPQIIGRSRATSGTIGARLGWRPPTLGKLPWTLTGRPQRSRRPSGACTRAVCMSERKKAGSPGGD